MICQRLHVKLVTTTRQVSEFHYDRPYVTIHLWASTWMLKIEGKVENNGRRKGLHNLRPLPCSSLWKLQKKAIHFYP